MLSSDLVNRSKTENRKQKKFDHNHGPIDVIVLAYAEPHLEGRIFEEFKRQAADYTIRVLDMRCFL